MKLKDCKIGTIVKKEYARNIPGGNGDLIGEIVGEPIKYEKYARVPVKWEGCEETDYVAYQRLYTVADGWAKDAVKPETAVRR